ncbi:hypothetical protein [Brachybacterium sp. GCM10030252]|uniref:hypothetical protein n=1 Tax=Brachybacterium sp. GCM10030252 TaxID=3273380 RepID=UPI00361D6025
MNARPRTRTRRTVLDRVAVVLGALCLVAAVLSGISIVASSHVGPDGPESPFVVGSWDLRRSTPFLGVPVAAFLGAWAVRRGAGLGDPGRPHGRAGDAAHASRLHVGLALVGLVIALRMAMYAGGFGFFGLTF